MSYNPITEICTTAKRLPRMPAVKPRRPLDAGQPNGYLESDRDWIANNMRAVLWMLENAEAVRVALAIR